MAVLIDPPVWPAHGRLWSHLVSDTSFEELHVFAAAHDVPRRAFEGDHYDVPQQRYADLVAAGARPVRSRDLLRALQVSGLRVPKRRGERVLRTWLVQRWLPGAAPHAVDCIASGIGPPAGSTVGTLLLAQGTGGLLLADGELPALPRDLAVAGRDVGYLRARFAAPADAGGRYPVPRCHVAVRQVAAADLTARLPGAAWVRLAEARGTASQNYWWPLVEWAQPASRRSSASTLPRAGASHRS